MGTAREELMSLLRESLFRTMKKGVAIPGQPVEQWYFHRPLWMILKPFFDRGFALDGLEEPLVGPERGDPGTPMFVYTQLPGVLVARMRRTILGELE